jgi:hypothetical protein
MHGFFFVIEEGLFMGRSGFEISKVENSEGPYEEIFFCVKLQ